MRVLMLSKALVVGSYQRKAEELARQPGVELTVAVPAYWREGKHRLGLERAYCSGYRLVVLPMWLNGHYHVHFYGHLGRLLDATRPEVFHIDEEHYNLATYLAMRAAVRRRIPALFFTWQNILQRYPPPFPAFERYTFRHAAHALVGSVDAGRVLRDKGYTGPMTVIPQFGVDPALFAPAALRPAGRQGGRFVIGFAGRLIVAKGILILLKALATLGGDWELRVVGVGEAQAQARELATRLGIAERVAFLGQQPSTAMPEMLRSFDLLVVPSLTTPRWKEQFGRLLVEAMACGVPVIGSDSGEIPHVIGDAGIVVPEGDAEALRNAILRLRDDARERADLAQAGRARVLDLFTQEAVARRTYAVYQEILAR